MEAKNDPILKPCTTYAACLFTEIIPSLVISLDHWCLLIYLSSRIILNLKIKCQKYLQQKLPRHHFASWCWNLRRGSLDTPSVEARKWKVDWIQAWTLPDSCAMLLLQCSMLYCKNSNLSITHQKETGTRFSGGPAPFTYFWTCHANT